MYTIDDLKILEQQERDLSYESFSNEDALKLGLAILDAQKNFDRNIVIRITREEDNLVLFQYVMKGKSERNFMFAEGKHKAVLHSHHSSAWAYVACQLKEETHYVPEEGEIPAGGAFPILVNGKHVATVMTSGLHDGKDHDVILQGLQIALGKTTVKFPKELR